MGIEITQLSQSAQRQILRKIQQENMAKQQGKPSKYGNVKTQRIVNGNIITFDSQKEARRYDELLAMQRAGTISDLRLQPQFTLQESYKTSDGKRVRSICYVADFSYTKDGKTVVEDVKSQATKTPQYEMKRKMMQDRHGIEVREK